MARSVPALSTTVHAPPTSSTSTITSAPATNPRGTATKASNRPTGCASTGLYVPATTTVRPVAASSCRSNDPAGSTCVSAAATSTQPSRRTIGCGRRNFGMPKSYRRGGRSEMTTGPDEDEGAGDRHRRRGSAPHARVAAYSAEGTGPHPTVLNGREVKIGPRFDGEHLFDR